MPHPKNLYQFISDDGSFRSLNANEVTGLYFPLVNENGYLSSISPQLQGDMKLDQHSFLTVPVSYSDLHLTRLARNFWFRLDQGGKKSICWSVNGRSPGQRSERWGKEEHVLKAGFLWHKTTRSNKKLGIRTNVLNYVPDGPASYEIMEVQFINEGRRTLHVTPVSAIPIYARSADNLRDHRHVTSLLHRLRKTRFGLSAIPTMTFNERGHQINELAYSVVGCDEKGKGPIGFFPTIDSFIGEGGDLESPRSLHESEKPLSKLDYNHQGQEAMGALQFADKTVHPGQSLTFVLVLAIHPKSQNPDQFLNSFQNSQLREKIFSRTLQTWKNHLDRVQFETGDKFFNHWVRWVGLQPTLRKIYGCSFLPDFDYGRGGRGWRDLWQDCLALLLSDPASVREVIKQNFAGVRIDGTNATIIGRKLISSKNGKKIWGPEFIADRNNITRTWMDHGIWPFLTAQLYVDQTGDWSLLSEQVPYFKDAQLYRSKKKDDEWLLSNGPHQKRDANACLLHDKNGRIYKGSIFEHILVETCVQFFNVGEHNIIKLEDADWNDGLDMAHQRGESVAFTAQYAGNLAQCADTLEAWSRKKGFRQLALMEELKILLNFSGSKTNYNSVGAKQKTLNKYFVATEKGPSGKLKNYRVDDIIKDLRAKSTWIKRHLQKKEWIRVKNHRWFNGYYDNAGKRVEGRHKQGTRMTLTGQVFTVMSGTAKENQVADIVKSVDRYLWDAKLKGYRLNTDFKDIQPNLGRAFSFAYGEKENGAIFSHMVVMYANALYQRGFVEEGYRAIQSLYFMAKNSLRSRIFPGLPEYFNNEGRGRYAYLTGSASWYILTLLTQVFGVRGHQGDLLIEPKLMPQQFDEKGVARVSLMFAGSRMTIQLHNPRRLGYKKGELSLLSSSIPSLQASFPTKKSILIPRQQLEKRTQCQIDLMWG